MGTSYSDYETIIHSTAGLQKRISSIKSQDAKPPDLPEEVYQLFCRASELYNAWKCHDRLDLKLADIAICLLELSEATGIDLGVAMNTRIAMNEQKFEVGSQEWYDSLSTEMRDYFADGIK